MRKNTLLIGVMLFACLLTSQRSYADITDTATYTVSVPDANVITLGADQNFGAIAASELITTAGSNNAASHVVTVGDGVVATSTAYVRSNNIANASTKEYKLTFAPNSGSSVSITNGTTLVLTVSKAGASVDILLTDAAQSANPKLGDPAGTPVAFSYQDATNLDIPAASSIPFDATTKKAPLSFKMDLDESSLGMDDTTGDLAFDVTFTAIGLN